MSSPFAAGMKSIGGVAMSSSSAKPRQRGDFKPKLIALSVAGLMYFRKEQPLTQQVRFQFPAPDKTAIPLGSAFGVSPDGAGANCDASALPPCSLASCGCVILGGPVMSTRPGGAPVAKRPSGESSGVPSPAPSCRCGSDWTGVRSAWLSIRPAWRTSRACMRPR